MSYEEYDGDLVVIGDEDRLSDAMDEMERTEGEDFPIPQNTVLPFELDGVSVQVLVGHYAATVNEQQAELLLEEVKELVGKKNVVHLSTPERRGEFFGELMSKEFEKADRDYLANLPVLSQQEREANQNRLREDRRQWEEKLRKNRDAEYQQQHDLAESWANKPGLTNSERCHGLVWELHVVEDQRLGKISEGTGVPELTKLFYKAPGYATFYDQQKSQEIKDGLARSAKDLFT